MGEKIINDGIVADANIVKDFFESRRVNGKLVLVFEEIIEKFGLACTYLIYHEWKADVNQEDFRQWYDHYFVLGKIRNIDLIKTIHSSEKKQIHNTYGFPKSRDIHYIRCAINTEKNIF